MKSFRLDKIINLFADSIILAVIFFVPLYFALFLKTNNVFELNKIVLFKILVLLLLLLTLIKHIFSCHCEERSDEAIFNILPISKYYRLLLPRPRDRNDKIETFFASAKILVIPIFLLSLILSTLLSVNKDISFFGSYGRQQGMISYLYYFLFFILLIANIKTRRQIKTIIITTVGSSFLISIYGLIQAFGFDPLPWSESTQLRATSTFGQPNLLAMYLLLTIPLTAYLISSARKVYAKISWTIILITQILCLYYTYSLSGWVAFSAGAICTVAVYLFYYFKNRSNFKIKQFNIFLLKFLFPIIIFIALISGIIYYNSKNSPNRWMLAERWNSLTNFQSASLNSRFMFWSASWKAIKERPFFGYGPETQSEVLVKYYQKDWGIYEDVNIRPDRAHNLFIDILLTTGIIGLLAYLALLYLFFKQIIIFINNIPEYRNLSYAVLFAALSYLFALQLNFTFVAGEIYFWLYLALALIINNVETHGNASPSRTVENPETHGHASLRGVMAKIAKIILIFIIAGGAGYLINNQIKLLTADYYFRELQLSRQSNQYFGAIKMYEFIKDEQPPFVKGDKGGFNFYDRQFVVIMSEWLDNFADARFRKFGEEKLPDILNNIKIDTYDNIYIRGKIYYTMASEDKKYFASAENEFNKLIKFAPEYPQNYRDLADVYFKEGDYNSAINNYKLTLTKLPDLDTKDFNQKHKFAAQDQYIYNYLRLGEAYNNIKNNQDAEKYYNKAWQIDEKSPEVIKKIAVFYFNIGDFKKAIWYNEKGMELMPDDYYWSAELAKIYVKLGDKPKAAEYYKKANELANKIDKQNVK